MSKYMLKILQLCFYLTQASLLNPEYDMAIFFFTLFTCLNLPLPSTPNTSSEYYMECAARTNDGFKKEIKSKQFLLTSFRILLFFWFLSREIDICGKTSGRHHEW